MPGIVSKILVSPVLPRCDTIFPVEAADIMAAKPRKELISVQLMVLFFNI